MEKEFIPYDRALKLKALGFDEPCFGRYGEIDNLEFRFFKEPKSFDYGITSKTCLAPTFSQCFKWFREKYELDSFVRKIIGTDGDKLYCYEIFKTALSNSYTSFEEAELSCMDKLTEIVEQKQKQDGK